MRNSVNSCSSAASGLRSTRSTTVKRTRAKTLADRATTSDETKEEKKLSRDKERREMKMKQEGDRIDRRRPPPEFRTGRNERVSVNLPRVQICRICTCRPRQPSILCRFGRDDISISIFFFFVFSILQSLTPLHLLVFVISSVWQGVRALRTESSSRARLCH